MCQHRSYEVLKSGRVLSLPDSDSHAEIQRVHNLRDTALYEAHHTSVEMLPDRLDDCSGWSLHFDTTPPEWWTPDHEKAVRDQLRPDHAVFWNPKTKSYRFQGDLYLLHEKHFSSGWISKKEFLKLLN